MTFLISSCFSVSFFFVLFSFQLKILRFREQSQIYLMCGRKALDSSETPIVEASSNDSRKTGMHDGLPFLSSTSRFPGRRHSLVPHSCQHLPAKGSGRRDASRFWR